ncbi:uncharacterized protein LOC112543282 [Python bivittatus]|uniref:Uncharacterized protein LOC112543282 n=1 Tax=Python bivittatus TaxID=176946 RepID=A0A9F5N0N1_PYTBI|nr:uncharacterized protein LOC112543282 [Python bivittatus]
MQEVLDKRCTLTSTTSLEIRQVLSSLHVVTRKNIKRVTYGLLELPWSTCGELLCAIVTSPCCSRDAIRSLLLAKVKEVSWPPPGGEEQSSHPLPAATASAISLIGRIVRSEECPVVLEAWFPEVLLCLMDIIIKGARPQNPSTHGGDHGPLEETVDIIHVLLAKVAHLFLDEKQAGFSEENSCCVHWSPAAPEWQPPHWQDASHLPFLCGQVV